MTNHRVTMSRSWRAGRGRSRQQAPGEVGAVGRKWRRRRPGSRSGDESAGVFQGTLAGLPVRLGAVLTRNHGASRSLTQDVSEDERRHEGGIRVDHELRRVDAELAPGDLLVRHRARVRPVADVVLSLI